MDLPDRGGLRQGLLVRYTSVEFTNRLADWGLDGSYGSVGDAYDNAAMETFWAILKREIRHIWGPWETITRVHSKAPCSQQVFRVVGS